jgi:hypothetical protein
MMDRDNNRTRGNALLRDMDGFLGLTKNDRVDDEFRDLIFDICPDKYHDVRANLVEIGMKASFWIEDYFLKAPRVVVSDRLGRIRRWRVDPCKTNNDE